MAQGYVPGIIGRVAELHGRYYHSQWGFGSFFEAKVASEFAEFICRYEPDRDHIWSVLLDDCVEGSIIVDGIDKTSAHIRWFIMSDQLRGKGMGYRLINEALAFCRQRQYPRIHLWTFEGLVAAQHLYEKCGFSLVDTRPGSQWGVEVIEQRYEVIL